MNKELAASLNMLVKVIILSIFAIAWCVTATEQRNMVAEYHTQTAIEQQHMAEQAKADSEHLFKEMTAGKDCTKTAFLTNNVLVTGDDGVTFEWFTFDKALDNTGTYTVVAYCK
jgi:hypothetical protein